MIDSNEACGPVIKRSRTRLGTPWVPQSSSYVAPNPALCDVREHSSCDTRAYPGAQRTPTPSGGLRGSHDGCVPVRPSHSKRNKLCS